MDESAPRVFCGAGDLVCRQDGVVLLASDLAASVAVAIYCPQLRCGGILNYLFPHSSADMERARREPAAFADTGLPRLVSAFRSFGGDPRRARVWLAGGASHAPSSDFFSLGERNLTAGKAWLWKEGLAWESVGCGGIVSRNLFLELRTGTIGVRRYQDGSGG